MNELPNIEKQYLEIFLFLLLMGGRARKVSFEISDLGSHDRPFLVGRYK
jgi:hypothetical protein